MFSNLIPDMNSFKGSDGGRALPMLHPDGDPNTVLLQSWGSRKIDVK